jgi:butyryl-CoA dehydrogenase
MFTMMNDARLMVGIQGVGTAEAAYQAAAAYAAERLQGRAPGAPAYPEKPADPLLVHPDVRRMLLTMRTHAEGTRAFAGWVARALDAEKHDPDPDIRHKAAGFVALMTPVVKALCTDLGHEAADICMQVLGGHGYIADHGIEQMARDGRVTRIYEGANGIQALDLVRRKLKTEDEAVTQFFFEVQRFLVRTREDDVLAPITRPLRKALISLKKSTIQLTTPMPEGELESAATDYLRLFGLVALGLLWGRMAAIAAAHLEDDPDGFYKAKLLSARFFAERILPQTASLAATIAGGSGAIGLFDEAAFVRR